MKQLLKHILKQVIHTSFAKKIIALCILSTDMIACNKDNHDDTGNSSFPVAASVLSAAGDSAVIIGTINTFRGLLGDSLNNVPGKISGRREVNWDAVPAAFTNANNFPGDFFNSTLSTDPSGRKRGLVMVNAGGSFRVDSSGFAGLDSSYASQFTTFSKKRLFASVGTPINIVTFKVPGTATDAFVKGFGVVFSDVDNNSSTTLEFFNGATSLGVFKAAAHPASGNFSFLGVRFKDAIVTTVIITSGNGILAQGVKDISNGGSKDLVVMDDFFYDEPHPVQK